MLEYVTWFIIVSIIIILFMTKFENRALRVLISSQQKMNAKLVDKVITEDTKIE